MSSSPARVLFILFYLVILLFATSDLKRFIFHVHISRVDRVPVEIDIDSSSSLWYPISIGIIFNIFILIFSIINLYIFLWRQNLLNQLFISTLILLCLFTIRFIINIILTKYRNGLATPTLVERSFFASSLSLEEELTTIILNWLIKIIGFICTFIYCYKQKQQQTMNVERQSETKLMSNFE
ncbi:unnamed protein product [Rotaria sordida]|uniref:Uncharacterized protein n=1 Tax=Rotaria sordida TaxID=392033 RepID=A0A813ZJ03_9BILA|nr:unnamed protein product [Rotaria sordida]